jgi:hypothetical protein
MPFWPAASAVFGSTTIAYGPCEGNGSADLVCQYFVQQVLGGSSLGRAALEARQKFAGARTHLDPYDLKTLMQFYLLGDPSAQPVAVTAHSLTRGKAFRRPLPTTRTARCAICAANGWSAKASTWARPFRRCDRSTKGLATRWPRP